MLFETSVLVLLCTIWPFCWILTLNILWRSIDGFLWFLASCSYQFYSETTMASKVFTVLLKMSSTKKLFLNFKSRYSDDIIRKCNLLVRTRNKITRLSLSNEFLKNCTVQKVAPKFIVSMVSKSKLKPGPNSDGFLWFLASCSYHHLN